MHRYGLVMVVGLGLATAACGAGHRATSTDGRALFHQACGVCHTISGVNTPSRQGGDLLAVHLRRPVLLQFAREMPLRRRLGTDELNTIADYILTVQRHAR
jgi:mono/diheme cytochrome c family protein